MFKLYSLSCNMLLVWVELLLLTWRGNIELLDEQGPFLKIPAMIFFSRFLKPFFVSFINRITMDLHWSKSKMTSFSCTHKKGSHNRSRKARSKTRKPFIREVHKPFPLCHGLVLSFPETTHLPGAAHSQPAGHLWENPSFITHQNTLF